MKIKRVSNHEIVFDNDSTISFDHCPDCCEHNYADFSTLNENNVYYDYDFNPELEFKFVDREGFKFGSDGKWIFIPCYSEQNGYYSSDIDILYDGKYVLNGTAKYVYRD